MIPIDFGALASPKDDGHPYGFCYFMGHYGHKGIYAF